MVRDDNNLRLNIRLNAFSRSTIPQPLVKPIKILA